jgi:hypothetical protein
LRRDYGAIVASLGINGDALLQREAGRAALAMVRAREAARVWATLVEKRKAGRGRRPSPRAIERAARRVALDDGAATQALDRLRELAAKRNGNRVPTPAEVLEQMTGDGRG